MIFMFFFLPSEILLKAKNLKIKPIQTLNKLEYNNEHIRSKSKKTNLKPKVHHGYSPKHVSSRQQGKITCVKLRQRVTTCLKPPPLLHRIENTAPETERRFTAPPYHTGDETDTRNHRHLFRLQFSIKRNRSLDHRFPTGKLPPWPPKNLLQQLYWTYRKFSIFIFLPESRRASIEMNLDLIPPIIFLRNHHLQTISISQEALTDYPSWRYKQSTAELRNPW